MLGTPCEIFMSQYVPRNCGIGLKKNQDQNNGVNVFLNFFKI